MKVGILGGGQLGQMLTLAAHPLTIGTSCFDQSPNVPAARVGEVVAGALDDRDAIHAWAKNVDLITYEFENFPAALVADLAEIRPVAPPLPALAAAQDRWAEKRLFNDAGIPVPPFRTVTSDDDLVRAVEELGFPLVAKTRTGGYDGKGQAVLRSSDDLGAARDLLSENELIVEQLVDFATEVSIIGCRSAAGEVVVYPLVENEHRKGILNASRVPAKVSASMADRAKTYIEVVMKRLDYVGVLTIELFNAGGRLLANEMAPRVHNSGHWTIEAAATSQFENHLRAVTGLPLGSTELVTPAVMLNLIGALPTIEDVLAVPGAHVHLYGKSPRPGRKLGHVTITAPDAAALQERVVRVESLVRNVLAA